MQEDFQWMADHWWLFAILVWMCVVVLLFAFMVGADERTLTRPKSVWRYLFCKHKNAKLTDNDQVFQCPDCGVKRKI